MQKFCHFASKNIYKWPKTLAVIRFLAHFHLLGSRIQVKVTIFWFRITLVEQNRCAMAVVLL